MENDKDTITIDKRSDERNSGGRNKIIGDISILSTKLSTDQLICKTPQDSPDPSVKSLKTRKRKSGNRLKSVLYLGILQFILGFLMITFGILVIIHKASLSQLGGGIWGGCVVMSTGVAGILTAAGNFCPLKTTPQKFAHTIFLALSLISLAIAQLIVVIGATGLARDFKAVEVEEETVDAELTPQPFRFHIDDHYSPRDFRLLFNIALIIVSSLECLFAAAASYKSSRDICPCFRRREDNYKENLNIHRSHDLVNSWLGKQNAPPQPIYVVTGPTSTLGGASKRSNMSIAPVYAMPPPPPPPMMQPQVIGYPLIPAPLGPVPSPIIPPPPPPRRETMQRVHKKYRAKSKSKSKERDPTNRRSKSRSRERQITEEDVARTYTGLDRTMAEEFIDICESKNASLCSDYSSSSSCQSPCAGGCNSNSDAASNEYLVNKVV